MAASLAVSVDKVARQQLEIKRLTEQINTLKKKGTSGTNGVTGTGGKNVLLASIAKRLAERLRTEKTYATSTHARTKTDKVG